VIKIQNNVPRSSAGVARSFRRSSLATDAQIDVERRLETPRASAVSRSFEGVQALAGVTLAVGQAKWSA